MAFLSLSLSRSVPPRQNEREEKNEALWFDWLTCSFACVSVKAASKRKVTDERVEEKEKNNIRRMISSLGNRWVFDSSFCWWPTCPRTQGDTSPELRAFFKQKKKPAHLESMMNRRFFLQRRQWFIRLAAVVTNNNNSRLVKDYKKKATYIYLVFSIQLVYISFAVVVDLPRHGPLRLSAENRWTVALWILFSLSFYPRKFISLSFVFLCLYLEYFFSQRSVLRDVRFLFFTSFRDNGETLFRALRPQYLSPHGD